jgi:GAF domain-containing protein/CheY-like chemotaxis protein
VGQARYRKRPGGRELRRAVERPGRAGAPAGLTRELRARLRESQTLLELSQAVGTTLDLTESLRRIARETARALGADMAGTLLADPAGRALVPVAGYHVPRELRETLGRSPIPIEGHPFFEVAWTARCPLASADAARDERISAETRATLRPRSLVFCPVVAKGEPIGGLLVVWWGRAHRPTAGELRLVEAISRQAGLAVDNARLYAEAERRRREAEVFADVARGIAASLDLDTVLQRVTDAAQELCAGDISRIALRDPSGAVVFRYVVGTRAERAGRLQVQPGKGIGGLVLVTGQPFRTGNYAEDPRISKDYLAVAAEEGVVATQAVPIRIDGRVEGLIHVDHRTAQVFTDRDEAILTRLSEHAAVAIRNARLFGELGDRLRETESLLAVGQALSRNLMLEEAMRRVAREVGRAVGADMVGAYAFDARLDALVPMAGYHVPKPVLPRFLETPIPLARVPALREAWQAGKPVWTGDVPASAWLDEDGLAGLRPRALLVVPTPVRGEVVGGLVAAWWQTARPVTAGELRLVEGIASQVGLALENAELVRQTREKLRETETLLSASHALGSTLDLPALLRHFNRHVARTIGADSVGVWLIDAATGKLEPLAGYRVPADVLPAVRECRIDPAESPFYAEGIATRRVLVSREVPGDARIPGSLKAVAPHRAQLFGPIVAKDRVIGAFIAVWWERVPELSDRELRLVQGMGSQAGAALDNARLFQEHQRKLEELAALYEVSRAVTGQLDVGRLVQTIHEQVSRVLDTRNMVVLLYAPGRREFEVALRMLAGRPDPNPVRRYPLGIGLMSRVIERRQPLRTTDYLAACRAEGVEPVRSSLGLPHWLGVPILAGDEEFGVLALRDAARPFSEADERLLTNIAGVAGLALRSARLFESSQRAHDELRATQDQLIRSEKLRAVGEMAAGVAHDFNNILAAIMGRAQLLLTQVEDPGQRRQLQIIEQAAVDGARTVRRIQEFTRMRRARPFEPVDLNQTVDEVVEVTRSRWKDEALGRGITYDVRVEAAAVPAVSADASELREVLTNLVLNALDAMPDGGVVTLRTSVDAGHVLCAVSDTGIGMTDAVRQRVFDPFFTTKAEKGTGLGLSVAYGIITRHGGEIDVRSEPWRGSTFTIRLPRALTAAQRRAATTVVEPSRSGKILLIDDEEAVRQTLADVLLSQGHAVTPCPDGRTGLARFHEESFDLVFTDLGLPGLSGWEVTRLVKLRRPETPVVLITGWGDQIAPEEAQTRGADFLLAKPFELDGVRAVVAEALAKRDLLALPPED